MVRNCSSVVVLKVCSNSATPYRFGLRSKSTLIRLANTRVLVDSTQSTHA